MATTDDSAEFDMAKAQVGRTISEMDTAHKILRRGDAELGIPRLTNDKLRMIFEDPMVGLDLAVYRYLERARAVHEKPMEELTTASIAYIFLTTYGPHVLEPMFDSVVEEYGLIAHQAILRIERLALVIWIAALVTPALEATLIFRPLEKRIRDSLDSMQGERSFLQHVINGVKDPIRVVSTTNEVLRTNSAGYELAKEQDVDPTRFSACRRLSELRLLPCACEETRCVR